jgi:8-oxo-dGTP pyrophosphatase MutT (NUDIX family)
MDPQDNENPMLTAILECKEETGLDIYDLKKLCIAIHKVVTWVLLIWLIYW